MTSRAYAWVLAPLVLVACPVDERKLAPEQSISFAGYDFSFSGEGGALAGASDDAGAGHGGSGGHGGSDTGAHGGDGGDGAEAGVPGQGGSQGGTAGMAASAGTGGTPTGGVAGAGASADCPDLDQNLVSDCKETLLDNSDFDEDTASWSKEDNVTATWDMADAGEAMKSGSMEVTDAVVNDGDAIGMNGVYQCVKVTGGKSYYLAAELFIAEGQTTAGSGALGIVFYDQDDCTGIITAVGNSLSGLVGAWQLITIQRDAPEPTRSARVRLAAAKPFREPHFAVSFDNVLLR